MNLEEWKACLKWLSPPVHPLPPFHNAPLQKRPWSILHSMLFNQKFNVTWKPRESLKKVPLLDLFSKCTGVSPFFFFLMNLMMILRAVKQKQKKLSCLGRLWSKPDSRQEIPLVKKGDRLFCKSGYTRSL